ncbi:MAG: ankrin repeat domain-containing protein [Burkholderiaceae bacterium]|jgi:ankyrin repeat protein|nr:MAG: ankrin repeat domain-containing protein [Burkholderiaceae bacterium]
MSISFKKILYLAVFIGVSAAHAGAYEDFFQAVRQDDAEAVKALLARGFDPNTRDDQGKSGLFLALGARSLMVAQALLDTPKIDVETRDRQDESPLMMAALKGELAMVQQLIAKGADINKPGWTPLHYAATGGHDAIVSLLLDHSAYIDAESPNGTTPLMMAAFYGTSSTVNLLLDQGADPTLKNQQGLTAIDFARRGHRPDAVKLITQAIRAKQPKGKW